MGTRTQSLSTGGRTTIIAIEVGTVTSIQHTIDRTGENHEHKVRHPPFGSAEG